MITWTDNEFGSGCYCIVAKLFRVSVSWEQANRDAKSGYRVSFAGACLSNLFDDQDEAKVAGLRLVQHKLSEVLKELEAHNENTSILY